MGAFAHRRYARHGQAAATHAEGRHGPLAAFWHADFGRCWGARHTHTCTTRSRQSPRRVSLKPPPLGAPRRGIPHQSLRQTSCPHCLSPMYPSHSCSVQPYAQTWVTKTWTSMEGDSVNHRMQLAQQAWLETRKHGLPQSLSRQFKKHRIFMETLQDWDLVAEGGALYYGIGQ